VEKDLDWTEEFEVEIREARKRQLTLYAVLLTATVPVLLLVYLFFFTEGSFLTNVFYFYLGFLVYLYVSIAVFYALLGRAGSVRAVNLAILVWDSINLTIIVYAHGAPHFHMMMLYVVGIVVYSIYVHPVMATRLFVLSTALIGVVSALIVAGVIPFGPVALNPNYSYPRVILDYIDSDIIKFVTAFGFVVAAFFGYVALRLSNTIVMETRRRERELRASHREIADKAERITLLSEKLAAYMPRQFVESLAKGERSPRPDYKRKRLTVFFSDVKGFTPWTDKLEPEETRALLNQYLSEMSKLADEWGGTIVQFVGDAIMIFFGDPEFTDDRDHALRSVRMGLAMQARMAELRAEWEDSGYLEPLHIRIGINTGYATVGAFGSEDRLNYTALGSTVNIAARLESICEPDRVTISHATYALVKGEFECKEVGDVELKGFHEPVRIYEVTREIGRSD